MSGLGPARPIEVRDLFGPDRDALLDLLRGLSPSDWSRPTVCAGWTVKDVALHILGGDLGNISRRRDGARVSTWGPGEDAGAFLARVNQEWVEAARRLSPRLVVELLEMSGPALFAHLRTLDPAAMGGPVSWAGSGPAPVWLDLAREYMERWVHQQHIRDAVGLPGQQDQRFVQPVIAASMHALPVTLGGSARQVGAAIVVIVEGDGGGRWSVVGRQGPWRLFEGTADDAEATIALPEREWWRLVTLGLSPDEARARARVSGDTELVDALLRVVAIIA